MSYTETYLEEVSEIVSLLNKERIENIVHCLFKLRCQSGRLFLIGVGGSAANASHAANDFRKLCGIEAYCPTDNVAELTARTNDEGWKTVFLEWLKVSRFRQDDVIFVLSVGGGNPEVSPNIVEAVRYAKYIGAWVLGIVGMDGGYTFEEGNCVLRIPIANPERITPHTEAFQSIILHLLATHPLLRKDPL
jgi:D-sedoheptulose 7-phosphate isomerase